MTDGGWPDQPEPAVPTGWAAPAADGTVAVNGPDGTSARFLPRPEYPDDLVVIGEVWRENVYHVGTGRIRRGYTVIDLGANIGTFSVLAARLGADVIAVEPDAANVAALRRNLALNAVQRQVLVVPGAAAAWDRGRLTDGDGPSSGSRHVEADPRGDIPGYPLTELAAHLPGDGGVDVVKIDIEGGEWPLLDDTEDSFLCRVGYLAMEWHAPVPDGALGRLVQRLAEWFQVEMIGRPSLGGMLWATRYPEGETVAAEEDP